MQSFIFDILTILIEVIIICITSCMFTGVSFCQRFKKSGFVFLCTPAIYIIYKIFQKPYISTIAMIVTTMILASLFIGIKTFDFFYICLLSFIIVFIYECLLSILIHFIFQFTGKTTYLPLLQCILLSIFCVIIYFVYRHSDFHIVYDVIRSKSSGSKMLTANGFCIILFLTTLFKCHVTSFYNASVLILFCTISLTFVNIEYFRSKKADACTKAQLKCYDRYMPIIEGLIDEIRIRQHDYNNELQSLYSLITSYDDIEMLRKAVTKYNHDCTLNAEVYQLLKLNTHLLGGLLIAKHKQAASIGTDIVFDIKNYNLSCCVPEYELVDMCGILIDNAIEHSSVHLPVYISLAGHDNTFTFSIKNPGPTASQEILEKMFTKGYTTKQHHDGHGIGMYKLKEMTIRHNGDICISNEIIDNTNYLCIQLKL